MTIDEQVERSRRLYENRNDTAQRNDAIRRELRAGATLEQVSRKWGVSERFVFRLLNAHIGPQGRSSWRLSC